MGFLGLSPLRGKIIIVLLGVIVLGVGLHSHFQSSWVKTGNVLVPGTTHSITIKLYKVCQIFDWSEADQKCPPISMERYYVAMIIICFILSMALLIAEFVIDLKSGNYKYMDLGYHGVSAVLLFIAAIVYMTSAVQAHNIWSEETHNSASFNFRKSEKVAAGCLTILQSILYAGVAFLIFKEPH